MADSINYDKIISLIYTEKSNKILSEGKYIFKVTKDSCKKEICSIISSLYNIKVISVNIINVKSRQKRFRGFNGTKPGYKKAIVTVEKGKAINLTN